MILWIYVHVLIKSTSVHKEGYRFHAPILKLWFSSCVPGRIAQNLTLNCHLRKVSCGEGTSTDFWRFVPFISMVLFKLVQWGKQLYFIVKPMWAKWHKSPKLCIFHPNSGTLWPLVPTWKNYTKSHLKLAPCKSQYWTVNPNKLLWFCYYGIDGPFKTSLMR